MKRTLLLLLAVSLIMSAFMFSEVCNQASKMYTPQGEVINPVPSVTDVSNWSVNSYQVLLNGHPFFAKGVCYQPVPVNEHPNNSPNGDYFTNNYAYIYNADLDRMHQIGINSLKIYSWYPDKDHSDFLNACVSRGIYVIVGYYMPPGTIIGEYKAKLELFQTLARMTASHPAIMGYMLGNENVGGDVNNPSFWNNYNSIAAALKTIAPNKLTFTGLVDDGMISVKAGNNYMSSLDVWGINVFRGEHLGDFYSTYQSASHKPCMVTELGFPSSIRDGNGDGQPMPDNGEVTAEYIKTVVEEVDGESSVDHPEDPVAGVYIFEWNDEWWKQACPSALHSCGQNCTAAPNTHDYACPQFWAPSTNYPAKTVVVHCSGNTRHFYTSKTDHTSGNFDSDMSSGKWQEVGADCYKVDAFPGKYWDEEWFGIYTADRQPRHAVNVLHEEWGN